MPVDDFFGEELVKVFRVPVEEVEAGCKTTLLALRRAARPPHGQRGGRKRAPCEREDQLEYGVEPARVPHVGQADTSGRVVDRKREPNP